MSYPNQISETQSEKAATANENFEAVTPASIFGRDAANTSGLTWGYFGGYMICGSPPTLTLIAGSTVQLVNGENHLEATLEGVVINRTGSPTQFTSGRIPLYRITCSGGLVVSYTDFRSFALNVKP